MSSHVLNAYQSAGGIHGVLDEGYRKVIRDAGFFMVNEEFPFSSRGVQAEDKEYTFRLEPERDVYKRQPVEIRGSIWDDISLTDGAASTTTGFFEMYQDFMNP